MINQELVNILACPKCKSGVRLSESGGYIICDECNLAYTINKDTPIMLIDNAIKINENFKDK